MQDVVIESCGTGVVIVGGVRVYATLEHGKANRYSILRLGTNRETTRALGHTS
jgi:hypothetical protein